MKLLGLGSHIGNWASHSSLPNIGSKATLAASRNATKTATGGAQHSAAAAVSKSAHMVTTTPKNSIHPGSTAGWKGAKSVHLAHNNTGYMNPANQKARYTSKKLTVPTVNLPVNYNGVSLNRSTDFRIGKNYYDSPSVLKRKGL